MVVQSGEYITRKKKYFLKRALIWALVIAGIFTIGVIVEGTRASRYTVIAAVFVLGLAQNVTRYIAFARYKDPVKEHVQIVEEIGEGIAIIHSAVIPSGTYELYFEHIIISSEKIYFLSSSNNSNRNNSNKNDLVTTLNKKGLVNKKIKFINIDNKKDLLKACNIIKKEISNEQRELNSTIEILQAMIM